MRGDDADRYLLGVQNVTVKATIGPADAFPHQRRGRKMTRANLHAVIDCPAGCHGGGYELARGLHEHVVARRLERGNGVLRCRGYRDAGRGRRQACDHTLQFDAVVTYAARQF